LAGRTPREAFETFAREVQQSLSCVTLARFNAEGYRPIDVPYGADVNDGEAVPLRGDVSIGLVVALRYRVAQDDGLYGGWGIRVTEYYYALTGEADAEIIAYHWHPTSRSPVTWPHLHLGPALGQLSGQAARAHVPTGPIALQDVIRLAITDFGAVPRRADSAALLQRTRRVYEEQWPAL
jgi:hypothetical protein